MNERKNENGGYFSEFFFEISEFLLRKFRKIFRNFGKNKKTKNEIKRYVHKLASQSLGMKDGAKTRVWANYCFIPEFPAELFVLCEVGLVITGCFNPRLNQCFLMDFGNE